MLLRCYAAELLGIYRVGPIVYLLLAAELLGIYRVGPIVYLLLAAELLGISMLRSIMGYVFFVFGPRGLTPARCKTKNIPPP
jgi:hypothetical protein